MVSYVLDDAGVVAGRCDEAAPVAHALTAMRTVLELPAQPAATESALDEGLDALEAKLPAIRRGAPAPDVGEVPPPPPEDEVPPPPPVDDGEEGVPPPPQICLWAILSSRHQEVEIGVSRLSGKSCLLNKCNLGTSKFSCLVHRRRRHAGCDRSEPRPVKCAAAGWRLHRLRGTSMNNDF